MGRLPIRQAGLLTEQELSTGSQRPTNPSLPMRYLMQFVVPALILLVVIAIVSRRRRQGDDEDGRGVFLVLLVIGAVAAVAILFAIQGYLE
ncbi:MAG: hypothetical protein F4Y55_07260 [Gammaproteobacteria bacterium]|nr:hypothetical protein [Gammaproteobacteria bacterium]